MTSKHVDVDSTWDGKGSLDDHRQAEFTKLKEAGFGIHSEKSKARAAQKQPAVNTRGESKGKTDGE